MARNHASTSKALNTIRIDTERVLRTMQQIGETPAKPDGPTADTPTTRDQQPPDDAQAVMAGVQTSGASPQDPTQVREQTAPADQSEGQILIDEISGACVKQCMVQINKVLDPLKKFIAANSIQTEQQPDPELSEQDFGEMMARQMAESLSRRQKIALASKRLKNP